MAINLNIPDIRELKPRITVFGVGGAGGNAVNNMIAAGLQGVDFVVANTDSQALTMSKAERLIQMGVQVTQGLGAGSQPEVGRAAAEEAIDEIRDHLAGAHMVFITAGMGGGTGTGAAPVIGRVARELGILTVAVVTKPFHFEGQRRMRFAEAGIAELHKVVDTLLIIPNQNLFRVANEKTTFADAFAMADQVLYSGVGCITDLMVKEGLINLDFADVRAVMREMGKAMMGTGEASGEKRALTAAEAAIANPLIDDSSMKGAKGLLVSISGGKDLTLFEVDEAATRIREEVDPDANIIVGATFDEALEGIIRVSVVATGIDKPPLAQSAPVAEPRPVPAQRPIEMTTRAPAQAAPPAAAAAAVPSMAVPPVEEIGAQAQAAVAAAILPAAPSGEDVTIRPLARKPSLLMEQTEAPPEPAVPSAFIPPAPEPVSRRMPRFDELPPTAQAEIRAKRGEQVVESPEKRRMSLLQRLASVGLGRREDEPPPAPAQTRAPVRQAPPPLERSLQRPPQRAAEAPAEHPSAAYGKRQAASLDPHGRPIPPSHPPEEDQLDIPAFLRRQAN